MKKEKKKEHLRQQIVLHFRSEDISFVEKHYLPQNTKHLKGKKRQHLKTRSFFTCGKHRLAQNTIYQQAKKENARNKSLWMYCSPLKPTIILKVLRSGKRVTNERAYFLKYYGTLLKNLGKHWLYRFANFSLMFYLVRLLMFLASFSTDVCYSQVTTFESKRNDCCLPKVSTERTCCKRSVLRWFHSTKLSSNWNERSQFKDQRDQKINHKDQERSKDQRSSRFTDQRIKVHQRSKINKIKDHEDQLEIK